MHRNGFAAHSPLLPSCTSLPRKGGLVALPAEELKTFAHTHPAFESRQSYADPFPYTSSATR
ncbi:hypothetical protein GCM10025871_07560 [Deinococcus metallilatus]|nr:hypothetical protein GCM10025871_07560 [Deinococcus metallilatus]